MNRTIFTHTAASLVLASPGMGATYYSGTRQGQWSAPTQATASAQAADAPLEVGNIDSETGKWILRWQDPAAPGQRFDRPGKLPFMDIPLTPVYKNGASGNVVVTVGGHMARNLATYTTRIKAGRLDAMLEVPGNIVINEHGIEIIQVCVVGFVERAYTETTLDPAKRGQPLVVIYTLKWAVAQKEYLAVSCTTNVLQGDLRSTALLYICQAGMTEAQIRLVEFTDKPQPRLTTFSDIDGVIIRIGIRDGIAVAPDMTLFKIVDLPTVWVLAEIPES